MRYGTLILLVLLLAAPLALSPYAMQVAIQALVLAVFATGFNLLFRETGLLSFGHAAFFGSGAYVAALLVTKWNWRLIAAVPVSLLATAVIALVIGALSVRLTKIYFTMLTLAFAQMLWAVAHKWYGFTGGDNGITSIPATGILGSPRGVYYACAVTLVVTLLVVRTVVRSPAGYTLRAVRDNPARAEAIGISAFEYMVTAFVLSAVISSAGGCLHVAWQHSVFPDQLYWTTSAAVIIAVILGGSDYFFGPVIGAIVLVSAQAIVQAHTHYWPLALGLVLLALVLFMPKGVVGVFTWISRRKPKETSRAAA
jgi:branched-chain amino acid transport system permease protein